ncbi:hypothetical protein Efla_000319 [Eimeria flavescens]
MPAVQGKAAQGGPFGGPLADGRKASPISSKQRMQLELLNEIMKEDPNIDKIRCEQEAELRFPPGALN